MDILCIYFLFQPVLCSCLLCFCLATLPSNSLFKIKYCLVKRTHVLSSLAMKSMVNKLKEKFDFFSKTFTIKVLRNEVIVYPQLTFTFCNHSFLWLWWISLWIDCIGTSNLFKILTKIYIGYWKGKIVHFLLKQ